MTYRVLVTAPYMQPVLERFRAELESQDLELRAPPVRERLEEDQLLPLVGDVDGVICGDDRFTDRVLSAAPRLRVISKWGTGIDSIDRDACARRGIAVCNTPDAFTAPVADSALGYILAFARRQPWMDRAMKRGEWEKIPGHALSERTLGIIGMGAIGRAVARRARAFGMTVLGNDTAEVPEEVLRETGTTMVDKRTLLGAAHYVSIHCDLNPTSLRLIGAEELARMRNDAVLINTARGPIVDEPALVRALQERAIAGAALDVFEVEPLPADSPLREMDQVMLAPHNSNSSPAAWERVHRSTIDQLVAVLRQEGRP